MTRAESVMSMPGENWRLKQLKALGVRLFPAAFFGEDVTVSLAVCGQNALVDIKVWLVSVHLLLDE